MSSVPSDDCAWVIVPLPFGADEFGPWLDNAESLFRINSLLEITDWRQENERHAHLSGRNLSNDQALDIQMCLTPTDDGLFIEYTGGLKRSTAFSIQAADATGFQLRITDDYSGLSDEERKVRIAEVDRSLPQWGLDLYKFFRAWKRWSWLVPWRWYTTHVWLRMKPTARRITRWIWWITTAEVIVFLLMLGVLMLEQD